MKSPSPGDGVENESASLDWLLHDPAFLGLPKFKIRSRAEILGLSGMIAVLVFLAALGLQWIVYDRFLHEDGVRLVGSTIAAILAAILTERLEALSRARGLQALRRFEAVALLNHHIRNALQAIVYSSAAENAVTIRAAVERIEWTLREVLPKVEQALPPERQRDSHANSATLGQN
jgi:hypothetical protein